MKVKNKTVFILIFSALLLVGILWAIKSIPEKNQNIQEVETEVEETIEKQCINDDDCVVFGKTGDCNCGCFNKNYQWESEGKCFCAAPTSCKCVNGRCEGAFEKHAGCVKGLVADWFICAFC